MSTRRPLTVTIAIVLLTLLSVFGLTNPWHRGQAPTIIVALGLVVGACGLIAVVGLWKLKRWGLWLTIILSALALLTTVPGLLFGPTLGKVVSVVLAILFALVLVLVVLPASRKPFVSQRSLQKQGRDLP